MTGERKPSYEVVTAIDMARSADISPKRFRRALRRAWRAGEFHWHDLNHHWTVEIGSPEHDDMKRVLDRLTDLS